MSSDCRRCVVIGGASIELRRRLGPTAWAVFEELLLASTGPSGDCHATVSVRTLAGELGLAKDTVARALARLRRAGLVIARQTRTDTGAFATGSYLLAVPSSIRFDDVTPSTGHRTPRPRTPLHSSESTSSQLALAIEA
jgi:DNA-binding transcriptional ArsR family regulator